MQYINYLVTRYHIVYKIFLFVVTIGFIVSLFPKEGKFKWEFQTRKPWKYEVLLAPFDFPIYKTDKEYQKEVNEALVFCKPYFKINPAIEKSKLELFKLEFAKAYHGSDAGKTLNLNAGQAILDTVFKRGIIQTDKLVENKLPDYQIIIVDQHNNAREVDFRKIYTNKTAVAYINLQLKYLFERNNAIDKAILENILESVIDINVVYDDATSSKIKKAALNDILPTKGMFQHGERIITKGEIVTPDKFQILSSLKREYEGKIGKYNAFMITIGQTIIVAFALFLIVLFLVFFRKDIWANNKRIAFILLLIAIEFLVTTQTMSSTSLNVYIVPFCILPIMIRIFYDTRLALFVHLLTILTLSFLVPSSFEFTLIQIFVGNISIFTIINMRKRASLFYTSLLVFATYSLIYLAIGLLQEGDIQKINTDMFKWFAASSLFTLLSYPLIFLYEKLFGFTSEVTLLEITDTNSPLLRRLAEQAPGTFQHSIQVANLAEAAIFEIGGDALLIRAGALYHDVGKLEMPMYFTENQTTDFNPHEELSLEESVEIVLSHVNKGVDLAKKYNVPETVIDFIRTHHGTTVARYFFENFKKDNPDLEVDKSQFSYWGPEPFSKETAVLMMADSVEAASRSLPVPDQISISNLVDRMITKQMDENQFINANITFKDITIIKKLFKKKLINIYHARIKYPKSSV